MWETASRYSVIPMSAHILLPSRVGTAPNKQEPGYRHPGPSPALQEEQAAFGTCLPVRAIRRAPHGPTHLSKPQARLPLAFLGGKEERPGLCPAPSQSSAPSLPGHSMGSGCHQPNLSCACPHPSNLQGMGGPKSHLSSLTHGSGGYLRPSSAAQGITARGGSSLLPPPRLATASGDPAPACAGTAPGGSRPPAACKLRQGSVGFQRGRHAPRRGSPNTHSWARRGLPSREWPQSLPLPPLVPASPAFPPPVQSSRTGQCPRGWDNSAPAPKSQE